MCVLKRFPPSRRTVLVQLRHDADGRSSNDGSSVHVPLFDRCLSTLESKRGNLGIVVGSPPHVGVGLHHGGGILHHEI